ncbi:hypothetical protein SSX86_008313 [Deinandra increscens subsp. villosa]|uniref:Uncharacterized protein n=1 Tax=Deinandra increscens subsp. villosa TaxID=3103831 RepID=A0AAP0DF79_9ASTR
MSLRSSRSIEDVKNIWSLDLKYKDLFVEFCDSFEDIFVSSFEISFEEQLSMLDSVDVKLRLSKATELVDWHLQMRAIKEELGDNDDEDDDVASLERKMQAAGIPPNSVIFVAIANRAQPIPPPLLDRMEVIELPGYTAEEKLKMATRHLIPRVLDQHGLNSEFLKVPEASRVFGLWDCMNSSQANGTSVAVNTCADDSMEVELADKNTLVANKHVLGGSDGGEYSGT